ncbi:V-type ATP synthase subunit F [Picrophilus oshimae]|uniref:V/A-type H+-transporting ATPase subunit F n=1 Tax=Picrophilus torridus (strain ATCC 700027 / DSM 9790 / JCM 10055 / NBRC 100828 / KAW 2/3) TaxID=1122961 RepID=A0A8G2FW65_PICTO|nr:V-type ATP synthase subunit F [Picrophilus oshimae]SMD30617.1 V/A-type H+-transporting ATPase subunit F [Picrophilus oshimae DSM 9789]
MNNICVIGERELITGFKLIGIGDAFEFKDKNEVLRIFNAKKYKYIFLSQSTERYFNENELNILKSSIDPLVIFVPMPGISEEESVFELAKRILGIDIGD